MKNATTASAAAAAALRAEEEATEALLAAHGWWGVTTIIEDEDLMFGGKPLSALHEEDRRRASIEEEHRGRSRTREYHAPHPSSTTAEHKLFYPHAQRPLHHHHETGHDAKTGQAAQPTPNKKSSVAGTC